jgi:hypothetical protein
MSNRLSAYRARLSTGAVLALVAALLPLTSVTPAGAAGPTDCSTDPAARLAQVPSPEGFLGFPLGLGQQRPVTTGEIDAYLHAVDDASDRVVTGSMATSVRGRDLPYAIVSDPAHVTPEALARIAADVRALRDPRRTDATTAAGIAEHGPAVVWIVGNVHGGEKSGADASLRTLYELASGLSCDIQRRNTDLVTVIVPTQNPDGRDADRRQNEYGFDLNRDWFARTQPETDAKVELLRRYPPQVFVDAHEMGGRQYFFPPNADPIHHEIAGEVVDWINRIGAGNAAAFGYNGACQGSASTECYFNYARYDLFYMGYGDTAPSTGFGAAGMTYEKGSASAVQDRVEQQFRTQWATVGWAAANRRELLTGYYKLWSDALAQGRAGALEPNEVVEPGNTVRFPVPEQAVRSYFLLPGRQLADVRRLVQRLRRMDVEVHRLTEPLTVPTARVFGGRTASNLTVPAGAYWVPMAQPQKHWIQATLGEDPYAPFPYFYDVSSWSNPLLAGVDTVVTGDELSPVATPVTDVEGGASGAAPRGGSYRYPLDSAGAAEFTFRLLGQGAGLLRDGASATVALPAARLTPQRDALARSLGVTLTPQAAPARGTALRRPDVGLFAGDGINTAAGSHGEVRFTLGARWGLPLTPVTTADINGNTAAFTRRTTLVVPDGTSATGGLTPTGQANLRAWVAAGGTYLGLRTEGTRLARAAGLTSTTEKAKPADYQVIGSHFRLDADRRDPVAWGRPAEDFGFNNGDPVLTPSGTGVNVLTYPADDRFWHNGYTVGADLLKGSAAVVDEPTGGGHAVLFASNPLFRGYLDSGAHLVANALLYPAGRSGTAGTVDPRRASAAAANPTQNLGGQWRPVSIQVGVGDLARARQVVRAYTGDVRESVVGDSAYLVIPNPDGLTADEHPYLRDLLRSLDQAGVPLRSVVG